MTAREEEVEGLWKACSGTEDAFVSVRRVHLSGALAAYELAVREHQQMVGDCRDARSQRRRLESERDALAAQLRAAESAASLATSEHSRTMDKLGAASKQNLELTNQLQAMTATAESYRVAARDAVQSYDDVCAQLAPQTADDRYVLESCDAVITDARAALTAATEGE